MKIGYLGPQGTFAEEAGLGPFSFKESDLVSFPSVPDVIQAVEEGTVSEGIVPIENSIEGSINVTLDMLAFEANLLIEREVVVPIKHNLLVKKGVGLKDIKAVVSQPHATAQCRKFLKGNLPDVVTEAANSTAEAAKKVAEENGSRAAIATLLAAQLYGLEVIAEDIEDVKGNKTRFVMLGKKRVTRTGSDKTSIVVMPHEDRPGILLQILQEFAFRFINLNKIESRPSKKALGEYIFFIDMEGHIDDKVIDDAIKCLGCKFTDVKFLGSYPKA
ncbi:MAG: prephenate dehydratase [Actinomycetota bacterium]